MLALRCPAVLALAMLQGACIVLPAGNTPGPSSVETKTIEALKRGSTTRTDVLMAIGDPDNRYLGDRVFGYRWTEYVAWFIFGGGYSAAGIPMTEARLLLIEFANDGRILRMDIVGGIRSSTLDDAVNQWMSKVQGGAR